MNTSLRAAVLAAILSAAVYAQAGLGSITGAVVDSSEARIPGATVKVVQLSTNSERTSTTNDAGLFTLPSLVASRYTPTITASGFKEKKLENLDLNAFQTLTLGNVVLDVGTGPSTVVTVTAGQQVVMDSAVRYETIQSTAVTEMPLQGCNWTTLLKVIPGSSPNNVNAMNGREAGYDGYYLYNSPEGLVQNLVSRVPTSSEAEKYNQFRGGVGHYNVTSVLDMRRIEVGLRFKF